MLYDKKRQETILAGERVLISQPLVYLLQVPFSALGWGLFQYYKYWFAWTVLCLPMGYIGYYMKKDKWWGYLILFPMILLTAYSYQVSQEYKLIIERDTYEVMP